MRTWQFAKALHLQKQNGWTRFISMQHNYNLIAREEENEMIPLCADEGIQTMVFSPLSRGVLARPWGAQTARMAATVGHEVAIPGGGSELNGARGPCGVAWASCSVLFN